MSPLSSEAAAALALDALNWIASDSERASGFLGASGADLAGLRARAQEPDFLGFVLDHLLSDDSAVLSFAEETSHRPEHVALARAALPGGDLPSWT
ncbi:DUF3572 domain-containing protein [Oceanibium sediminis]|uniref:DUF3572 domain-containing protein n=1 Tax=Oceanibium sediminis TaxID=2026339 RepID=UPI000DD331CF|nr:DUF3572 domain-containing protein [Oceanibium sediminis]